MKILIGTLSNRNFKPQTVESLMNLEIPCERIFAVATQGYHIAENRNWLAFKSVNENCDYLFLTDDDMIFPPNTLKKLLSYQKDIVGVACHPRNSEKKTYVTLDKVHKDNTDLPKELFECERVGTGIMLIKTEVFKKLSWPFFAFKSDINGFTLNGEDWFFCDKAREAGFKIWCDPTLSIGHIGDYIY